MAIARREVCSRETSADGIRTDADNNATYRQHNLLIAARHKHSHTAARSSSTSAGNSVQGMSGPCESLSRPNRLGGSGNGFPIADNLFMVWKIIAAAFQGCEARIDVPDCAQLPAVPASDAAV
jgi:hypothetical protein